MTPKELIDILSKYSCYNKVVVWQPFPEEFEEDLDGVYGDASVKEGYIDSKGLLHLNCPPEDIKEKILVICG